jgi:hypothetical protein
MLSNNLRILNYLKCILKFKEVSVNFFCTFVSTEFLGKLFLLISYSSTLKVVGNEKEGGWGNWQMIDIGLGLW